MLTSVRAIALYLPQFHPIPENDAWWGKGFTEWTNTAKATPLFRGHYQPHIPADLGFYDLRVPETRVAQSILAKAAGIEGFCYYHYWFAGRRILERPFNDLISSGTPNYPFCLCWANETWSGIWHGTPNKVLIEQTYPGEDDHRSHFSALLPAFRDSRYIRVEGKPVFVIYKPERLPDSTETTALWQKMALDAGLPGLYFVGMGHIAGWNPLENGFNAKVLMPLFEPRPWISRRKPLSWLKNKINKWQGLPTLYDYDKIISAYESRLQHEIDSCGARYCIYPCVINNWDNTPRSGKNGVVLVDANPDRYREHLDAVINTVSKTNHNKPLVFLKSWNEWAEGNHLEPDLRDGHAWLEAVRNAIRPVFDA